MNKIKIRKDGTIVKAQKKAFLKHAINLLKHSIENTLEYSHWVYINVSFCNLYRMYFTNSYEHKIFKAIPEFLEYKPKVFYDSNNKIVEEYDQFWFKLDLEGTKQRLVICESILNRL